MSDTVIKVENLSKLYRLGVVGSSSLQSDLQRLWAKVLGQEDPALKLGESNDRSVRGNTEFVWALKEIDFEVRRGEILGIIGKNGAGKSTLLKLLSKVTVPTSGKIKIKGRIASLLEVGTGFHPDLSGRDNIFLNGAILGMTHNEIKRKFDEIVDFSGVERYIDTPVKRYSSGMYVRLAFAVAAHLEPEILIVDEVLAVGDAEFQKKCLGKMSEVSGSGRTILFVSHNMGSILNLCTRGLLMKNGQMITTGPIQKVVDQYLQAFHSAKSTERNFDSAAERFGNKNIEFTHYDICDEGNTSIENAVSGQNINIELHFKINNRRAYRKAFFSVGVVNEYESKLFHMSTTEGRGEEFAIEETVSGGKVVCRIPNLPLPPGIYYLNFFVSDLTTVYDRIDFAGILKVESGNFFGNGKYKDPKLGAYYQKSEWALYPKT